MATSSANDRVDVRPSTRGRAAHRPLELSLRTASSAANAARRSALRAGTVDPKLGRRQRDGTAEGHPHTAPPTRILVEERDLEHRVADRRSSAAAHVEHAAEVPSGPVRRSGGREDREERALGVGLPARELARSEVAESGEGDRREVLVIGPVHVVAEGRTDLDACVERDGSPRVEKRTWTVVPGVDGLDAIRRLDEDAPRRSAIADSPMPKAFTVRMASGVNAKWAARRGRTCLLHILRISDGTPGRRAVMTPSRSTHSRGRADRVLHRLGRGDDHRLPAVGLRHRAEGAEPLLERHDERRILAQRLTERIGQALSREVVVRRPSPPVAMTTSDLWRASANASRSTARSSGSMRRRSAAAELGELAAEEGGVRVDRLAEEQLGADRAAPRSASVPSVDYTGKQMPLRSAMPLASVPPSEDCRE